jgi:DNA replication protein DnaC
VNSLQHERIVALAEELRLGALPDLYGAVAQSAAQRQDASYADFLEEVLKGERDARRVRARAMLTRTAGFPALKTLEAYDFAFATGAPRVQIQELASLGFVERAENLVLLGPSGTGKTTSRSRSVCSPRTAAGRCASPRPPIWPSRSRRPSARAG